MKVKDKITRLAAIVQRRKVIEWRMVNAENLDEELRREVQTILQSLSKADLQMYRDRLVKMGYIAYGKTKFTFKVPS